MPHYFFDTCEDGHVISDEVGLELPGIEDAKREAARSLADLARDVLSSSMKKREFAVEVRDALSKRILRIVLVFDIEHEPPV
ncbi:MAG: hypothetical protein AB7S92_25710 [Parvibaculaceae bacterium]